MADTKLKSIRLGIAMNIREKHKEYLAIYAVGGVGYYTLEIVWRGYSHWTMALTGGFCFLLLYLLSANSEIPLITKCVIGAAEITAVEFLVGCAVNIGLGWSVWDYSRHNYDFLGQICLEYSLIWVIVSYFGIWLCQLLRGSDIIREFVVGRDNFRD